MTTPITARLPRADAERLGSFGVRLRLEQAGIDVTKPIDCKVEGEDLVYTGSPVTKGSAVTEDNRGSEQ